MASESEKIERRSCLPVEIGGETFYVRELLHSDGRRVRKAEGEDAREGLTYALSIVDETGALKHPVQPGETDDQWAERVNGIVGLMPAWATKLLTDAIEKLCKPPNFESLKKN